MAVPSAQRDEKCRSTLRTVSRRRRGAWSRCLVSSAPPRELRMLWCRSEDGCCHALDRRRRFLHFEYDGRSARGGWDFYCLGDGLSLAVIDVTVEGAIERRHALTDHLVVSAVLEGKLDIADLNGIEGGLADRFATVFGLLPDQAYDTVYKPGQHLQWVTISFIDSVSSSSPALIRRSFPRMSEIFCPDPHGYPTTVFLCLTLQRLRYHEFYVAS